MEDADGWESNPVSNAGRYVFVTDCIHSDGPSINALRESAHKISLRSFQRKLAPGQWAMVQRRLGYDRRLPLTRDPRVSYYASSYRGVPAVFFVYSGIEQVFTLDGVSL